MIRGTKSMFAGCIEKMSRQSCGTCERRDDCAFVWPEALGFLLSRSRAARPRGEAPPPARNPFFAFLGEVARAVEAKAKPRETPFRREVERRMEPLLAAGPVRIDRIARELGYSRQTLYRRLKAEEVTFQELLDGLRHRLALRFVREEGLSVKEAAWRLGFSDPAAFSRAFKRWTGKSPRDMRPGD